MHSSFRTEFVIRSVVAVTLALGATLAEDHVLAQGIEHVKAHYTKYEYRIPMRDGTRLFTSVYVPKDTSRTYPFLMTRTPYNVKPYGVDQYRNDLGPSPQFGKAGYIFVYQDVRGRWMSEGEFVNMRPHLAQKTPQQIDESTDTYDTIDWLIKQIPNHNGKVGLFGSCSGGRHAFIYACQKRDIDAVHRRAAHQSDCRFHLTHLPLSRNLESC